MKCDYNGKIKPQICQTLVESFPFKGDFVGTYKISKLSVF